MALGLLGRGGRVDDLRVDHDFGLRPLLDAIDGLLDRRDRLGLEDAGEVVDGPADLRLRERRSGGCGWLVGRTERCRDREQARRGERGEQDSRDGAAG